MEERACIECDEVYVGRLRCPCCNTGVGEPLDQGRRIKTSHKALERQVEAMKAEGLSDKDCQRARQIWMTVGKMDRSALRKSESNFARGLAALQE